MVEFQTLNVTPTKAIRSLWTTVRSPPKGQEYYKILKEKYEHFIDGKELLPVPARMGTGNRRTISLLTTHIKTHKFIGINRKILEEALKSLKIGSKILARRSNATWDILLATENAAKDLAGSILIIKAVRLQTEYLGTRKPKVTLYSVTLYISVDHLGLFCPVWRGIGCLIHQKQNRDSHRRHGNLSNYHLKYFYSNTKYFNV